MLNKTLCLCLLLALPWLASAQSTRTIDGTGNNLTNTTWGSVGEQLARVTTVDYLDGISTPGGINRPNPRIISNMLFAQDSMAFDPLNLSDFIWVFGQFVDHDITSVSNDPTEPAGIPVNFPDVYFNPGGAFPNVEIHMSRSAEHPGTGTSIANPREHTNNITGWVDASNVYGSDAARASYLRTFVNGKLKVSAGDLLPYNTTNHEQGAPVDPSAPFMDNENPFNDVLFVAGDSRANEQPLLACFHTLFVREHNRLCDEYLLANPAWNDEQLYQKARRVVGALIQSILYEQWLVTMGVNLPAYTGYDSSVDPNITNVFAGAAFRLGHTLLNSSLRRIDVDGVDMTPALSLKDAFFNPFDIATTGMDPFFRGMAAQIEQDCDGKVVGDVRNFLFGPPGAGGLDLAAININRGRERGLPDFNTLRTDFGLPTYTTFQAINPDPSVYTVLENLYPSVDDIDPWVGMLVEFHMPNALFGETIMHIMMDQFAALRDGDRFYYEGDPFLTQAEKDTIKNTVLRDIIMRNTGVDIMQYNVFEAMPYDSICMSAVGTADLAGGIQTYNNVNVTDVDVEVTDENGTILYNELTDAIGDYMFEDVATCEYYTLTPVKDNNYINGLSTFDLVKIIRHVLEIELLDSPYKIIGADANANGEVTLLDVVLLRKILLFIENDLPDNTAWRFVDADYIFDDPIEPLDEDFPEFRNVEMLSGDMLLDFVGIRIGDMNGSATGDGLMGGGDDRSDETLVFDLVDQRVSAGEQITIPFYANDIADIGGYQFTLNFDPNTLALDLIEEAALPGLSASHFGLLNDDGAITTSWNGNASRLEGDEVLFSIQFTAQQSGKLSDWLSLNSRFTKAEAYTGADYKLMDVSLRFKDEAGVELAASGFELYQNKPNPFKEQTTIGFNLSSDSPVTFKVFDVTGRLVLSSQKDYTEGFHEIDLDHNDLSNAGDVLYYQLETIFGIASKKMLVIR